MSGVWSLRTVILDSENKLLYYDGKTLKGEILLAGTEVEHAMEEAGEGRQFPFRITNISSVKRTQTSTLTLAAGSHKEADEWVIALAAAAAGSTQSSAVAGYVTFEVGHFDT